MPSTHTRLHYHVAFSTRGRQRWLTDDRQERLHAYLCGTVRAQGGVALAVGGVEDHRTRSFQEEYLGLLREHGVEYDERYLW